jgi:hypothetical protein
MGSLSAASVLGLLWSFIITNFILGIVFCFIVGFVMIPVMVVSFELSAELTYPIGETMSTGVLMSIGSIMGILYVKINITNYVS